MFAAFLTEQLCWLSVTAQKSIYLFECTIVRLGSSQTVLQQCSMQHGFVFAEMHTKISESCIWGTMLSSTKNNDLRDTV